MPRANCLFADSINSVACYLSNRSRSIRKTFTVPELTRQPDLKGLSQPLRAFGHAMLWLVVAAVVALTGCGSGGYAGNGITSLSSSAITIDAGQSFQVTTVISGSAPVSWSLVSTGCTAAACGSLSNTSGAAVTYTAPAGITTQLQLTLTAALTGTTNSKVVDITVNPDPTITGVPPPGTVGTAYSTTLTARGGTRALTWSLVGSLPEGLSFNATTGVISGTPTTAGSFSFTAQVIDSSDVPYTVKAAESISIASPIATVIVVSGQPPHGTVGVSYSITLSASGGASPYSWSVLSGSLPAGLAMSGTSGVIAGTPTTQQTSMFTAQAEDGSGAKGSAAFSITVGAPGTPLTLTLATLPGATVNVSYSALIGISGGTPPYSCIQTGGTVPPGLTLAASCVVSGTPTTAGPYTLQVKATDSSSPAETTSGPESIAVAPAGSLTLASPGNGTVGTPYSGIIGVTGGTAPYSCVIVPGSLPAGLTLGAECAITGTPTASGTFHLTVTATDSSSPVKTITGPVGLTIVPGSLTLTVSTLAGATVNVPYYQTIGVTGGTAPYGCLQMGGTLPPGLTLLPDCVLSGTPTTAGPFPFGMKATDSSSPAETATGPESITVAAAGSLTLTSPASGTVGTPYTGTIGVTGGTPPYSCSLIQGSLPAGLNLGTTCIITGTPTGAGSFPVTVKATDGSSPPKTSTQRVTVTIAPAALALTSSPLPAGTVGIAYSATVGVSGGTAPYFCTQTGGIVPPGLTLSAGCVVSGTPTTAGPYIFAVKATDSGNPLETAAGNESISVTASIGPVLSNPPPATINTPYTGPIGITGGTGPYTCALATGPLPPGITLGANCVFAGIPTTAGSYPVAVTAADSSSPPKSTTTTVHIMVSATPLTITTLNLPTGTVGTPYSHVIGVSGGTAPYLCSVTAGTLPAGLTLDLGCLVSGTPTVAASPILGIKASDSGNPVETTSGPVGLTIVAANPTLTLSNPPSATVNVSYSGTIGVSGGSAPYTCVLAAGSPLLPPGLTLNTNCVISGAPAVATTPSTTVTVKATDSSSPAATTTGPITVTVLPVTATLTLSNPPNATVTVPYTGIIGVSGGTAPYACVVTLGPLPPGLTLGTHCGLTGTPTTAGAYPVTTKATDSATPTTDTVTGPVVITVSPIPALSLAGSLPNATLGVAYTQTLHAIGGIKPYAYSLTAGTLPTGLTLSSTGAVSGTPTGVGASSFTVTVTDAEPTPQTASLSLVLLVVYATKATDSELVGPYAFLFQGYDDVAAGVLAYQTATVASFTADGAGVISSGELDSNHQSSNPTGKAVASQPFVGSYTLGADNRGLMTVTTLNVDGSTAETSTYAITVKAPVAPAIVATQASMIEFDDNQSVGARGSGTMLAQRPAAFSAGLDGSYAFGLSGDTPCLLSCTLGIAGPVASVGVFTAAGSNTLSGGSSDANIATTYYAEAPLTGNSAVADGNGRVALTMDTAGTPVGIYPADYAVYLVNANQAFVMSTDKHSEYVLLAGTAQLQTQAPFTDASLNGALIGYENAQSNPGLLGATLGDTLNLSTATIFRATGNAAGSCDFTNVDVAGLTGLVNGLTGLGSSNAILDALLGTYQSTGTSVCTVAANGRGVLNYPAPSGLLSGLLASLGLSGAPPPHREFYLVSPNRGYFLETGYAGLGEFEPQTGTPFSLASFDGSYIYASPPAASLASINTTGVITSDGLGNTNSTLDTNIGIGTINVLETSVTSSSTYLLLPPDTTTGRFALGATVVFYEIAPGRFVLVDTNALTTSPSISLLY
jgi:large repetitive protein